jgi:4-hydroxybenzoate polyprenyltransferase
MNMQASPSKVPPIEVSLEQISEIPFESPARSTPVPQPSWPLIQLLRPKQWVKNGFVIAPLIFSEQYLNTKAVFQALLATGLFCITSSAVYLFNDLCDYGNDRLHPEKKYQRPLAAGLVSVRQAKVLLTLLVVAIALILVYQRQTAIALVAYLALNVAYSLKLKSIPVIDIFCIATGFVLRVFVGGLAISVTISSWMLITTLCLALYLAVIKRKQELRVHGNAGRSILGIYTLPLLDRYGEFAAMCSVVFYGLFVIEVRPKLVVTVPIVLLGFFRYGFIVESKQGGESPTDVIWTDLPLALTVLAWVGLSIFSLWSS